MSIQMLPLRQIGFALSSSQWTEELPHAVEKGTKEDTSVGFESLYLSIDSHKHLSSSIDRTSLIYIYICERIPSNHSTDIVSPPPDERA
jgi:hypothetical protein